MERIEKDRERERERDIGLYVSACVMFVCVRCCVRVWLRALCVCVGFLLLGLRTHSGTSDNFYNYFDNFRPWTKIMTTFTIITCTISDHGWWFHSKPCATVIFFQEVEYQSHSEHFRFFFFPYPFQSHFRSIPKLEHKGNVNNYMLIFLSFCK
ncbi:unnamed protein product [Malus baccata var. baccata]